MRFMLGLGFMLWLELALGLGQRLCAMWFMAAIAGFMLLLYRRDRFGLTENRRSSRGCRLLGWGWA